MRSIAEEGASVHREMTQLSCRAGVTQAVSTRRNRLPFVVPASRDGWVTKVVSERILTAVPAGTTVRLETRVGAYIHRGEALATLSPVPNDPQAVVRRLSATVLVGNTRTMQEDLDFAIRQLVDVGLRALSSAINDPTTATEVVLRLGSLLRQVLVVPLPAEAVCDGADRTLLRPWELRHDEYINHAFDQLRQSAPPQARVIATHLRVLRMLIEHVKLAGQPQHLPALLSQMQLLLASLDQEARLHPRDLSRLRAIGNGTTDPADHSGVGPDPAPTTNSN